MSAVSSLMLKRHQPRREISSVCLQRTDVSTPIQTRTSSCSHSQSLGCRGEARQGHGCGSSRRWLLTRGTASPLKSERAEGFHSVIVSKSYVRAGDVIKQKRGCLQKVILQKRLLGCASFG